LAWILTSLAGAALAYSHLISYAAAGYLSVTDTKSSSVTTSRLYGYVPVNLKPDNTLRGFIADKCLSLANMGISMIVTIFPGFDRI
jgi:hypothetical protein